MNGRAAAVCVALLCALPAGCGGGQDRQPQRSAEGTHATDADVLVLARVLAANREHGGARFTATLDMQGEPALATGRVDFRSGRGTAVLRPADARLGPPRRFFWTRREVLAQTAPGSRRYARQMPDEQGNPVHAMIGYVNQLSAETIDNTADIRDKAPRLIRHTTIARAPVDEFRYGRTGSTTLWILRGSGLLRRIRTRRVTGGLTVDLISHEPMRIQLPSAAHG
jgi:hypothetical protein